MSLVATLLATAGNPGTGNRTVPGGEITFKFSRPPDQADDVVVTIEHARFRSNSNIPTGVPVATFRGRIRGKRYQPSSAAPVARTGPDASRVDMRLKASDGTNKIDITLVDSGSVLSNQLRVTVTGSVAGRRQTFPGNAVVFVNYPLSMIVPAPTLARNLRDPALNMIATWAAQFAARDSLRHVHSIPTLAPPASIRPAHYDPLIDAFADAVSASPGGIIALAVGHGDGGAGTGRGVPWFDLMPENIAPIENADGTTSYPHTLFAHKTGLIFGASRSDTPRPDERVMLNALDRVADVLRGATIPIRKVLLHTCNVGQDTTEPANPRTGEDEIPSMIQRVADRLRVPVESHRDFIVYEGAGPVLAGYETSRARSETEWPRSKVSEEARPGRAPRRLAP